MTSGMIPAVYENGTFRIAAPLLDLTENQLVKLFYVVEDDPFEDFAENTAEYSSENGFGHRFDDDWMDNLEAEFEAAFGPSPQLVKEQVEFAHKIARIWHIEDDELLRWIAEDVSLYDDESWL